MEPRIVAIFDKLFKNCRPRYHLALDKKIYDNDLKRYIYRFKIYGIHSFAKYTFSEIEKDEAIAYEINPFDLIEITINEYKHIKRSKLFRVVEQLRDNQYKISNVETEEIINGEDLLYDPFLIKKISRRDIRNICHKTGLLQGRKLSKNISSQNSNEKPIIQFKVIK